MGDPAHGQRRVRLRDGGCLGGLHAALRPRTAPGLPRRVRAKQLVAETRSPLPAEPGQAERFDCEYERCGTANLFMLFEPLAGKRHVEVTERRTAVDFAHVVRDLADVHYPAAKKIVLVMDNLNTHRPAVPGVCTRGGASAGRAAGNPLHAQARQLAGHGRDRIKRLGDAVP